jgi:hypothetical protein
MNKKSLMLTVILLAMPLISISPAKAITKEPYWDHVEFDVFDFPSKLWYADEIMHIKDMHWSGSYEGTLADDGTFDVWFEHLSLNLKIGKGTYNGKWLITIPGQGTLAGSARGKLTVTGPLSGTTSGTYIGTDCAGSFEGIKKVGRYTLWYEMDPVTGWFKHAELDATGTIIYP